MQMGTTHHRQNSYQSQQLKPLQQWQPRLGVQLTSSSDDNHDDDPYVQNLTTIVTDMLMMETAMDTVCLEDEVAAGRTCNTQHLLDG